MKKEQKKRTRRAGVCAFVITLGLLVFAIGMYTVDAVSGRTLHGSDYRTDIEVTAAIAWLPSRMQVVWKVITGAYYVDFLPDLAGLR